MKAPLTMLFADNHMQQSGFSYGCFDDIKRKAKEPVTTTKSEAPICAPHNAQNKTKTTIEQHNSFTMLWADIDTGSREAADIQSDLEILGIASYVIYGTASSTETDKRWRVLVEINQAIDCEHWSTLQHYLCNKLSGDTCATKLTQIAYLPIINSDNQSQYYDYKIGDGDPLDIAGTFAIDAIRYREEQEAISLKKAEAAPPAKPRTISLTGGQISPVDAYNQSHELVELLKAYGFRKIGRKYLHPNSTSGIAGVVVLDGRYYSHHSLVTDPLADNHTHDAFDLFIQFEHGGSVKAAVKAAGEILTADGVSISKANQMAYREVQNLVKPATFEDIPIIAEEVKEILDPCEITKVLSSTQIGMLAHQRAEFLQFPKDSATLTALGIVSAVVSMRYGVCFEGGSCIPTGLYVVTEQPPATGKSSLLYQFEMPIAKAINAMNAATAKANELSVDENMELPHYSAFITDATPEALESILKGNGGHFSMASTEQGIVNTVLGATYGDSASKKKTNKDLVLKGYSGEWHSSIRTTRKGYSGNVYGSVTVLAQEGTIDTILEQSDGTGVAERFLMLAEPTLLGHRDHLTRKQKPDDELVLRYQTAVEKLVDEYKAELLNKKAGFDNLQQLHIPDACWDALNREKQKLEHMMKDGGKYSHSLLRGAAGKFDQRVMKIAAVLHVIESLMSGEQVHGAYSGPK